MVNHEPQKSEVIDFDEEWYLQRYADVAAYVKAGGLPTGLAHYQVHGRAEGRLTGPPKRAADDEGPRESEHDIVRPARGF